MVVKASPASALEVIESDLLFELLIVTFDSPSDLRQADELFGGRIGGHRGQPELGRLCLSLRPLDHKPLPITRSMSEFVSVSRSDTQEGESRAHAAEGALPPRDRLPRRCRQLVSEKANGKRSPTLEASDERRWPSAATIGARR